MSDFNLEQIERVLLVLPQTQCTQCGYEGCRPYAQAIVDGTADINRCPPGGENGVERLSAVTGIAIKPLDSTCGVTKPRHIAVIDPARCIGCTLCIAACPVDAIVGAPKAMHQVISKACTGCDLCLPPCPVDCISMVVIQGYDQWTDQDAALARRSYEDRGVRLKQQALAQSRRLADKAQEKIEAISAGQYDSETLQDSRKHAAIRAALEKVRQRRS